MTDTIQYEISVGLELFDFECDPRDVSKLLALAPTKTWLKGDKISQRSTRTYDSNGWSLFSPLPAGNSEISDHLRAIENLVRSQVRSFCLLPEPTFIQLSCIIYAHTDLPSIGLTKEEIRFLAELGASFDVDLYDLRAADAVS